MLPLLLHLQMVRLSSLEEGQKNSRPCLTALSLISLDLWDIKEPLGIKQISGSDHPNSGSLEFVHSLYPVPQSQKGVGPLSWRLALFPSKIM